MAAVDEHVLIVMFNVHKSIAVLFQQRRQLLLPLRVGSADRTVKAEYVEMMKDLIALANRVKRGRHGGFTLLKLRDGMVGFALKTLTQKIPSKISATPPSPDFS